jgi:hypothetical protein
VGALAAVGAAVARAVTTPSVVRAAGDDGSNIVIGGTYGNVQSQTTLGDDTNDARVLWVASNDDGFGNDSGHGVAVTGYSAHGVGLEGWSGGTGPGVYGHAVGHGVECESSYGTGVYGKATNTNQMGVSGESWGTGGTIGTCGWVASSSGTGVEGFAGSGTGNTVGVHGYTASSSGKGVFGEANATGSTFGVDGLGHGAGSVGSAAGQPAARVCSASAAQPQVLRPRPTPESSAIPRSTAPAVAWSDRLPVGTASTGSRPQG